MGMAARGHEVLEQAKAQLIQAKTVEQLRQAQAVYSPYHAACRWSKPLLYWAYRSVGHASYAPALRVAKSWNRKPTVNTGHGRT